MKLLSSVALLALISTLSFSQNYKTVIPDTTTYFIGNTGVIKAINIKTIYQDGVDTVYKNFHTAREDTVTCSGFNSYSPPINKFGASWLGEKVVIKPDGTNIFFNNQHDSIIINTKAAIGESWKLFKMDNENYLEATVSDIINDTILGIADSVKTISIQAKDSLNNLLPFPINSQEIRISKSRGFIRMFNFYNFPSDTNLYQITDTAPFTKRDAFNYEVGDIIQILSYYATHAITITKFIHQDFLSKSISSDSNTIFFSIKETTHSYYSYPSSNDVFDGGHSIVTRNISITDLDSPVFPTLPDETYIKPSSSNPEDLWQVSLQNQSLYCENRRIATDSNFGVIKETDSCWAVPSDDIYTSYTIIEGVGSFYSEYSLGGREYTNLHYYQSGSCSYGTLFTGTQDINPEKRFTIYPHPAAEEVNIELLLPSSQHVSITIYDATGKVIYNISESIQQQVVKISTTNWSSGFYLVRVASNKYYGTKKLLIQK